MKIGERGVFAIFGILILAVIGLVIHSIVITGERNALRDAKSSEKQEKIDIDSSMYWRLMYANQLQIANQLKQNAEKNAEQGARYYALYKQKANENKLFIQGIDSLNDSAFFDFHDGLIPDSLR